MLRKYFTAHPASMGETYVEHCVLALGFSGTMFAGAIACLIHALVPGLFTRTGSGIIERLHRRMVVERDRQRTTSETADGAKPESGNAIV